MKNRQSKASEIKTMAYCDAKKWTHKPPAMCCSKRKIQLPLLADPPLLLG